LLRRETGQKFPHLANAGKYSCAFFVVIFGNLAAHVPQPQYPVFHVLWACAAVLGSLYNWLWDCKMDWGLFTRNARHPLLRSQLKYRWVWVRTPATRVFCLLLTHRSRTTLRLCRTW
jgi:hypothetical protein